MSEASPIPRLSPAGRRCQPDGAKGGSRFETQQGDYGLSVPVVSWNRTRGALPMSGTKALAVPV